jgi:plastocyanin
MRRLVTLAVAALALVATAGLGATTGSGQVREVSMPGKVFVPGTIDVLVGDTVAWRNGDATNHTVTANGDAFDSGYIAPGGTYTFVFTKPGVYAYHCTIHKFMRGVVRVVAVALSASSPVVLSGGRVALQGLAPAGTSKVTVVQGGGSGQRTLVPAADGSFGFAQRVFAPTTFRALVAGRSSRLVTVAVAPLVRVHVADRVVTAAVRPARAGARAVLQRYDRERFAWRTIARGVVDGRSRAAIRLPAGNAGHFRVVVRGGSGWADGASAGIVAS